MNSNNFKNGDKFVRISYNAVDGQTGKSVTVPEVRGVVLDAETGHIKFDESTHLGEEVFSILDSRYILESEYDNKNE